MNQTASDIVQAVPAEHRRHAGHLIEACQLAMTGGSHLAEITALINRAGDYGPWIENVRQAIRSADLPEMDRATMLAVFNMAAVVLMQCWDAREIDKRRFT